MRKFEKISFEQFKKDFSEFENLKIMYKDLKLPKRKTLNSAGYDFSSPFDFVLHPTEIIKVNTGIKVSMENDDCLMILDRSSAGFKYNIRICNQVGLIDSDYYNNPQNEGHICIALQNEGEKDWIVKRGESFAQGLFTKYLIVDDEEQITNTRTGGIGSTNKEVNK
ncbi:MAG: deoxyuridine 5'-triphosphate nucleotidohydrolase [Bacilli bacterium]|nr:deoxyuridine 5'-triphosphate nucleotidohydrolase [Bacilli bacterium]MDD3304660.1 deoxyuridine 5'-triphosphate nucleotidohydrolase [Bacilli bacterium]MDD4053288.1 deoxyuridine 5'-triphosphate nucleotidohydrolase [Bacilli bacterium]MDD4411371.1 deoxyuridine 5'-triphosphate nucleotidohydrolase [Bacilli bacterium]